MVPDHHQARSAFSQLKSSEASPQPPGLWGPGLTGSLGRTGRNWPKGEKEEAVGRTARRAQVLTGEVSEFILRGGIFRLT